MTEYGVCTNLQCARSASGEPLELYPGPGRYCPQCGEELHAYRAPRPRRHALMMAGVVVLALGVLLAGAVVVPPALGAFGVRVCTTAMTDRIGNAIVNAYTADHTTWPYHYTVTRPGDLACDVRFLAGGEGSDASIIARDGIVAVVNPQNALSRLTINQLRDVFAGRIGNWSQLGGPPGAIAAVAPPDGTDAAAIVADRIMQGQPFGANVVRSLGVGEAVRTVASPSGLRSIGIVPFSEAVPAKVIALDLGPPPSAVSIADNRYALAIPIRAESDFRRPVNRAADLIAFALSNAAKELVSRASLISKDGS